MNIIKKGCLTALTICTLSVSAQNLASGYFDQNYLYRFQSNPAFGNDGKWFVAMPGLGNVDATTQGNVGLDNFFYNIGGKTTTFLNPEVPADRFIKDIENKNRIGADVRATILAGGWAAWGGYNTVTVSARATAGVYLPKEIFRLAKEGVTNDTYNIGHLCARAQAWGEISLGHSRSINKRWRVGGNLKFLLGAGNAEARFNRADLALGTHTWTATVDASLHSSIKNLSYKTDYNRHTDRHYVNGIDFGSFGLNGFGMAIDLGGVFTLNNDWQFSLALLDLGFINWSNDIVATTGGVQTVVTDRYSFNVDDDTTLDKFKDDLSMLYQLTDAGDRGSRTTALGTTLNAGAQYTLPVYRRLKFGLLNTTRIQGEYSWTDFRLSANIEPVKHLSGGINLGIGTFGASFGWLINYRTRGFNIFAASDHTPGRLAKQGVPLSSNANVNFGINFTF